MQLIGSDPDPARRLTYSATGLPEGATLDAHTGVFTWTPGPAQVGDYLVQFTVTDGELSASCRRSCRATLNPVPPQVFVELTPSFPHVPGSPVTIHVAGSRMAPMTGLTL